MTVNIKGSIISNDAKWIYDWLEMDSTCPKDVETALEAAEEGEAIEVNINSPGGSIFAASEIYTMLRKKKCSIHVVGLAASAASVIMCAGHCDISPTAMVMIHNVSSYAEGDYRTFAHESDVCRSASESVAAAYVEKTGMKLDEVMALMDEEKWFTAEEAVKIGLCDEITDQGMSLVASLAPIIPAEVVCKFKEKLDAADAARVEYGKLCAELARLEVIE